MAVETSLTVKYYAVVKSPVLKCHSLSSRPLDSVVVDNAVYTRYHLYNVLIPFSEMGMENPIFPILFKMPTDQWDWIMKRCIAPVVYNDILWHDDAARLSLTGLLLPSDFTFYTLKFS